MSEASVRVVTLEPMRVASFWAYGAQPEPDAMGKLLSWNEPKGLLADLEEHPVFGFNNPDPSPASPNYGYEVWIKVDHDTVPRGDERLVDFAGGLYAVLRVTGSPAEVMAKGWAALHAWSEDSRYGFGTHQWLERHVRFVGLSESEWVFDLYMPITEE